MRFNSRGFTLIATLLLLVMMSAFAIGLFMMVNTEQHAGGFDLNHTYTYHATEGAMEKMTSDLGNLFKSIQSPQASQICALSSNYPTWDTTVTYPVYNVAPVSGGCVGTPPTVWGPIASGPDQGLYAQLIPVTMNVEAQRGTGETVSMTRTAEIALIPVFQFGVFSDSDLFFGRSPNLGFAGRVHTNGDLYLGVADSANLVFGDKMSAFGNVIRYNMDNGVVASGNDDGGTVMVPTSANGCSAQMANVAAANPSATCLDISTTLLGASTGSVINGHGSAQNTSSWQNVSLGTFNGYLIDGNGTPGSTSDGPNGTGANDLTLPFVQGTTSAVQIIRRPLPGETLTSLLGASRLANEAQIRILLSDTEAALHLNDWNGDATQDIYLSSMAPAGFPNTAFSSAGIVVNPSSPKTYYFGEAWCGSIPAKIGGVSNTLQQCANDNNFVLPASYGQTAWASLGATTTAYGGTEWPILGGWLLVEVKYASDGLWHGATKEWLGLGFARGVATPVKPGFGCASPATNSLSAAAGCNYLSDHANAILYLQQTADRNGDGAITASDAGTVANNIFVNTSQGADSQYNWYPINFYDAREGENNDAGAGFAQTTGTVNGVLNSVELDVGNLRNWLLGKTGANGTKVDYATQNGYVLYFSDRRGMNLAGATQPLNQGEYGYEDTVNYANAGGNFAPDGKLDGNNYNGVSPEDVNGNLALDTYGVKYVGDAFGPQTTADTDSTVPPTPFAHRINTFTIGRANRVTGARHALMLVDGSLGNVPTMPPGNATNNCAQTAASPTACGGFTVAAENPVYILGNYNSNCPAAGGGAPCTPGNTNYDPTWTSTTAAEPIHSAASVIADAVTMLSNNWQDAGALGATTTGSLINPTNPGGQSVPAQTPNRIATTSYYRTAIAAGKNIAFTNTAQNPEFSYGMDGGVHNFLRFLEDWGGIAAQQQLYYKGSIVSMYWSQYATGPFKCCNTVYNPPDRQYTFDSLFSVPSNLPPATPMFRNVDNLSYRQNQIARTN
jgi:Tfp pilus assembly protein PilX